MEMYVMITSAVLAGVCLHLNSISKDKENLDRVIRVALILQLVHAAVVMITQTLPKQYAYIDWTAPFGLLYGPLLYMGYLSSRGILPGKEKIGIHLVPFFIAIVHPVIYLFMSSEWKSTDFMYSNILYSAMALSWLAYVVWVVYLAGREALMNIELTSPLSPVVIILFVLSVFVGIMVYVRTIQPAAASTITIMALITDLGVLGVVVSIYKYISRRFKQNLTDNGETSALVLPRKEAEFQRSEYRKSALKEDIMIAYSEKVNSFIESEVYLDMDLSLSSLATKLKIPKHHLSQLFSQHYKQGFLEYINMLRIRYACSMLNDPNTTINIADLAEQCGFRSKPSFYRNFKNITGMTPTEFQSSLKETALYSPAGSMS